MPTESRTKSAWGPHAVLRTVLVEKHCLNKTPPQHLFESALVVSVVNIALILIHTNELERKISLRRVVRNFDRGSKSNNVSTFEYLMPLLFEAPSIKCAVIWPFYLNNYAQI